MLFAWILSARTESGYRDSEMDNQMNLILRQAVRVFLPVMIVLGFSGVSGCNYVPNETWHCYDETGRPVEGVLIVCHYGLANYKVRAVGYRFSDAQGMIYFDRDGGTIPGELIRGYACVYSPLLRNGGAGIGDRWHEGRPVPSVPVYFDEWRHEIHIRNAMQDPCAWNSAVNTLISVCGNVKRREYAMFGPGIDALEAAILPFAQKERDLFIKQYGDVLVPGEYIKKGNIGVFFPNFSGEDSVVLRFRDITLSMP